MPKPRLGMTIMKGTVTAIVFYFYHPGVGIGGEGYDGE
jgi:hypothetical protein